MSPNLKVDYRQGSLGAEFNAPIGQDVQTFATLIFGPITATYRRVSELRPAGTAAGLTQ